MPPTFKFPERLIFPPVIVDAEIRVEATVPIELYPAYILLALKLVATIFIDVAFVL